MQKYYSSVSSSVLLFAAMIGGLCCEMRDMLSGGFAVLGVIMRAE